MYHTPGYNPNVVKMAILCELIYKQSMQSQYKPPIPFSYTYQQSDFKICKENQMDRNRPLSKDRHRLDISHYMISRLIIKPNNQDSILTKE